VCEQETRRENFLSAGVRNSRKFSLRIFLPPQSFGRPMTGSGDCYPTEILFIFVAAEKLVALDGGDDADGAFVARLGALNAAETANAHGAG